jgi:hypothetical protein
MQFGLGDGSLAFACFVFGIEGLGAVQYDLDRPIGSQFRAGN